VHQNQLKTQNEDSRGSFPISKYGRSLQKKPANEQSLVL